MTPDQKKAIAAKIKALLAKTEDNGATEAEAMAAAFKAKEMMDRYQLDMGELEMEADGFEELATETACEFSHKVQWNLAHAVSLFTETRCWNKRETNSLRFFGYKSDVQFAQWLIQALEGFVLKGCDAHLAERKPAEGGGRRSARKAGQAELFDRSDVQSYRPRWTAHEMREAREAFIYGACVRISERLKAMADARNPTGTGLVVSKKSRLEEELERMGMRFAKGRAMTVHARDAKALTAGLARGDAAQFNRPVNAGGGVRQIASR